MSGLACEFCHGKGWAPCRCYGSSYYPEGSVAILKCDECGLFEWDDDAQEEARRCGYTLNERGVVLHEPIE